MKYIVITGGVCSGIGKGVVTSSLGALLVAHGLKVTAIKIDPYINIDAGTFRPTEHGEVFVLNDGCEVDLDLGNYERFLDIDLCRLNNITTGKINLQVINSERQGDYLGRTVQIVPHVTAAIRDWIEEAAHLKLRDGSNAEICLIELGGTIGDIEGMTYLVALRQLKDKVKEKNFCCCHVSMVPAWGPSKELKSKPTQHSVERLNSTGPSPNMIVCRSEAPITNSIRDKIHENCSIELDHIFSLPNMGTIYQVPNELQRQGIIRAISDCLQLNILESTDKLKKWAEISDIAINAKDEVTIALVGKYTSLSDCYTSVVKSIEHACYHFNAKPKLRYIDSEKLEIDDAKAWDDLKTSNCLIVPGGFGIRGVEGKIKAIGWARQNKLPFLGLCLGFQMAAVEYARNVLGIKNAHSAEFFDDELDDPIELDQKNRKRQKNGIAERNGNCSMLFEPVVIKMLDYVDPEKKMGGTMRLGLKRTVFVDQHSSILKSKYDKKIIDNKFIEERHRHRYEINPKYIDAFEKAGLKFVGRSEDGTRMEILELDQNEHQYFVAVQYHPEYLSRPFDPSPPYKGLIEIAMTNMKTNA